MNLEKLKEIAEHLKEWIDCEIGDGCGKCDEMRNIIKELNDIAEAMQPETMELKTKCTHPRESRQYIGRNMLKCGICGYEFE